MPGIEKVRARINRDLAMERISGIETPILIMGREEDHLQGIFRAAYELMEEAGRKVEWVSYDHPMHGYVFPIRGEGGEGEERGAYEVSEVQRGAIEFAISFLDRYLKS
ncbi:MAG: hypothetical protein V3V56_05350 [bacterium]